jgi:hypothetical protein
MNVFLLATSWRDSDLRIKHLPPDASHPSVRMPTHFAKLRTDPRPAQRLALFPNAPPIIPIDHSMRYIPKQQPEEWSFQC